MVQRMSFIKNEVISLGKLVNGNFTSKWKLFENGKNEVCLVKRIADDLNIKFRKSKPTIILEIARKFKSGQEEQTLSGCYG